MVYPVTNTGAQAKIAAVENRMLHFGIPQSKKHGRGTVFLKTDFVNWTKELGITLQPHTAHSHGTNAKVETQNQHIARFWRNFLNDAGTIGPRLHQRLRSCIIPALITLLAKRLTKSPSAPNDKFSCLSNWDSTVTNICYVVRNFVQTCLLTLTTKTLRRMSSSRNYYVHNFRRLS